MSRKYPCPAGIEPDCGYPACAHASQCAANGSPASAGSGLMERLRAHIKEKKEDLAAAEFMARNESLRDKEAWAGIADKDRAEIALFEEIENVLGQNSSVRPSD